MSRVKNNTNWLTKITDLCFSGHLFGLHFSTLQRLNTKEDLDWNVLIQLCFVNKKLRKTERISYSTGIHPERGPPLKVFLFSRICNCRSAYFSRIQKRPLLGLCWLILSEGVFLPIANWRRKTWFSIEKVEWGSISFLWVQSG